MHIKDVAMTCVYHTSPGHKSGARGAAHWLHVVVVQNDSAICKRVDIGRGNLPTAVERNVIESHCTQHRCTIAVLYNGKRIT